MFRKLGSRKSRSWALCLASLGLLFLLGGGLFAIPSAASVQYHNVQIFLQTQSQDGNTYTLAAYESNGTLISNTQSQYPAFSLELPSGTYLFAASVVNKSSTYYWYYTTSEYGYSVQQISGDATINLQTQELSNIPTRSISINTQFVNGSAMSGASVYASVVGMSYWSDMYSDKSLVLWNQTTNGVATLQVPDLPVEVTAWNWVQVQLPSSETTVQKNIGGQTINVTVYWQPMYLGLSGSAVLIPPLNSAQITLYANEQPNYWFYPTGVNYASTASMGQYGYPGTGSVTNSPSPMPAQVSSAQSQFSPTGPTQTTGAPQQYLPPSQIPAIVPVGSQNSATDELLVVAVIAAVGLAGVSLVAMVAMRRKSGLGAP